MGVENGVGAVGATFPLCEMSARGQADNRFIRP